MAKAKSKKRKKTSVIKHKKLTPEKHHPNRSQVLNKLLSTVKAQPKNILAHITLADYYMRNHVENKILEALKPLEKQFPFENNLHNQLYNHLLAFGYVHSNRLLDAEKICQQVLENEPDSLDYHYILAFVHLSLREYDKVLTDCRNYFSSYERKDKKTKDDINYSLTHRHLSQVYNFLGSAYFEKSDWKEAKKNFELSKVSDPGNHFPYLNLIKLAQRNNDSDEAEKIIRQGLSQCRQVQELNILKETLNKQATISACMIVKNEEELLGGCLESIRSWVDEIIVVDTGSTDKTMEIAKSYGAKIFHQSWEGNFSKHRNYSLEKATSDWIFIIDADERFYQEDVPQVKKLLNDRKNNILSIDVFNVYGDKEDTKTFLPSVRFFRRNLNLRYEGIVHNRLSFPPDTVVARSSVRIKHLGYDLSQEKMHNKFLRSKALLEKQLEENPDNAFALFNYAQLLRGEGGSFQKKNAPAILKAAGHAVELTDPKDSTERHIHLMCLDQIAWVNFFTENYDRALEYTDKALKIKPHYLDPLLLRGHVFSRKKMYNEACEAYLKYIDEQQKFNPSTETDNIILINPDSRATAYYGLAVIAELQNNWLNAEKYYLQTLKLNPEYLEANANLGRLYLNQNNLEKSEKYLGKQLEIDPENKDALINLALTYTYKKEFDNAKIYFNKVRTVFPNDIAVLSSFIKFCLMAHNDKELLALAKEEEKEAKFDTEILKQLGNACYELSCFSEAAKIYKRLVDVESPPTELLNNLGNCYFNMHKYEEAEKYYQQVLNSDNPLEITYRNLGLAQGRLNELSEAIETLKNYCQITKEEPEIIHIIGDLYAKQGKYDKALKNYEKCLRIKPKDPKALFSLSECYLQLGYKDSAILGYQKVLELNPHFEPAQKRILEISELTAN